MGVTSSLPEQLTGKELKVIKESWSVVMQNPEENGIVILKTFLDRHDYYSKFQKFKDISPGELPENKVFRNHAHAIIKYINEITENINDEERLKSLLVQLGRMHKARKITAEQFDELKKVILDILRDAFKLEEETLIAWNKTFDIAFKHVFQGLE